MKQKNQIGMICLAVATLCGLPGCKSNPEPETARMPVAMTLIGQGYFGGYSDTGGSVPCVGSYTGSAKITNSETSTIWFRPPTGTTNGTITDDSGLESPYWSIVQAVRRTDAMSWCGSNTVSFPATSAHQYKFLIYVKNTPPPPTNGQILTLDVDWSP